MRATPSPKVYITLMACLAYGAGMLVLAVFPLHQTSSVWKGFRVLTVAQSQPEQIVLDRLAKAGVRDLVTESNSAIREGDSRTPIIPFLADINRQRAKWFSDSTGSYRCFYLQETSFLDTKIHKALQNSNFSWNLEHPGDFNIIPVIASCIFLLFACFFVKNRWWLLSCGISFIFLTISCNETVGFIAAVLAICALATLVHRSEDPTAQPLYAILLVVPCLAAALGGLHQTLLTIAALVTSVAAAAIFRRIQVKIHAFIDAKRLHPVFRPVRMSPKRAYQPIDRAFLLKLCAGAIFLSAVVSIIPLFHAQKNASAGTGQELYIPSPSEYTARNGFSIEGYAELNSLKKADRIPDLSDFIAAKWNIRMYPWKKIRNPLVDPQPGDTLDAVRYSVDGSGKISDSRETMDTFNSAFIRRVLSSESTPLERMLSRQGRFVSVDFKRLMQ